MVESSIENEPRLAVSRIELDRAGPSYTVDTVEEIVDAARADGRPLDLTLVMSAEAFAELPTWHEPRRLLELARIAVGPRPGHTAVDRAWLDRGWSKLSDRVTVLDMPLVKVSASDIRTRVSAGRSIKKLVPAAVASYIETHHLYREPLIQEGRHVTDPIEPTATSPASGPRRQRATAAAAPRADGLPKRRAKPSTSERPPLDVARRIVELAEDKKAADIILLDLTGLTTVADAFVICSGGSERQLDAIADGVLEGMRAEKIRPIGREGKAASHWVLVDFGSVVVHIFTPPEREYYSLEKHWAQARTILRVQ
jgi:ribosome-associated protein